MAIANNCVHPGSLFMPVLKFGHSHKAALGPFCRLHYFRFSKFIIVGFAFVAMVYNFLEMWKNMLSDTNTSTLHSVLGYDFLLEHPLLNIRLHELMTIDHAFNVASNFHLMYLVFTEDYAALFDSLVWAIIAIIFKVCSTIVGVITSEENRKKEYFLSELTYIILDAVIIVHLVCPVFNYYSPCNFLIERL